MMSGKMKCLMKQEDAPGYEFIYMEIPVPGEGDLLVKVLKVSMCGSDIVLFDWDEIGKSIAKLPFIPGHECVAEIVGVGPNCPYEYRIGSRICCENHFYCGTCYQCTHDQKHICKDLSQYGHGRGTIHGGFSQYSIIPARYAYLLKTDIDVELACLLEPFGVAHQGVERLCPSNDTVLIQGCGPIGLYAIAHCKHVGAKQVIASDILPNRLELAKQMGADIVINGKTENLKEKVMDVTKGDGMGCLLECSGAQTLINNSFQLMRRGGSMAFIGIPKTPIQIEKAGQNFLFKSLTIHTIYGRRIFHTWEQCEKMLSEKRIDISPTISHRFAMKEFEEAFRVLKAGTGCKIIVDPHA